MPPRLFLCGGLSARRYGSLLQSTGFIALQPASELFNSCCYYMLLNLLVREFPGFVGKQAAQLSPDQESRNDGTMYCVSCQQASSAV